MHYRTRNIDLPSKATSYLHRHSACTKGEGKGQINRLRDAQQDQYAIRGGEAKVTIIGGGQLGDGNKTHVQVTIVDIEPNMPTLEMCNAVGGGNDVRHKVR